MTKERCMTTGMIAVMAIALLAGCGQKDADAAATNTEPTSSIHEVSAAQPIAEPSSETPATDFEYEETDGKITIKRYVGESMEIVIPAQIDGKDVAVIGDGCFANQSVTSVVCPDTLESIGEEAFSHCEELEELVLNEGLRNIETHAFQWCKSLEYVQIPSTVTHVGEFAFITAGIKKIDFLCESAEWKMGAFNGINIVELTIPSNIKTVGFGMFANCKLLETVVIEEGVEQIERVAFSDCKELKKVDIPASVTKIGEDVFRDANEELVLTVQPGSYAESYAKENNIAYVNP